MFLKWWHSVIASELLISFLWLFSFKLKVSRIFQFTGFCIICIPYWLLRVSLWNIVNVFFVWWLLNVCVFTICAKHSDGLIKLQRIGFPFSLCRPFLKTFPCLAIRLSIISWKFLLPLNAIIGLVWNTPWNAVFIWRILLFIFTILDMLRSVLLYVIDSGILFVLLFLYLWIIPFFQFHLLSLFVYLELLLYIVCLEISV